MGPIRDHDTSPSPFPPPAAGPARPSVDELVAIALARGEDSPTLVQTYLSIRGRFARRSFWLHGVLGLIGIGALASMLLEIADVDPELSSEIVAVMLAWPYIAITGKRLHDLNCSAWWLVVNLVPGVGSLAMLLVAGLLPGRPGDNRFGPDPRAARERERLQRPAFVVSSVH